MCVGVNPILWMIMPRLRQSVKALLCCCSRKHRYDEDDSVFGDETSTAMMEGYAKSWEEWNKFKNMCVHKTE